MGTRTPLVVYYQDLLHLLQGEEEEDEEGAAVLSPEPPDEPRWRSRTPAWASVIRGFSNGLGLAIFALLVVPLSTRCTNRDEVLFCVFFLAASIAFPALGYVFTWDLPEEQT